jgi:hypothetical protein
LLCVYSCYLPVRLAGQVSNAFAVPQLLLEAGRNLGSRPDRNGGWQKRASALPAETRPVLNKILVQSAKFSGHHGCQTLKAYHHKADAGWPASRPWLPNTDDRIR